jgi:hypothetical protein
MAVVAVEHLAVVVVGLLHMAAVEHWHGKTIFLLPQAPAIPWL